MQLFLIRHAQSENNARPQSQRVDDPGLTTIGHAQASRLAQRMVDLQLSRVISSPFLRALQTAEHIHRATGLVPEVRVPLHEKGGCVAGSGGGPLGGGPMQGRPGMTRQELSARFPGYPIAAEIDGRGWWGSKPLETLEQATQRAQRVWADTCSEFAATNERVALVMHGDFLMLLLDCFHPRPLNLAWNASLSRVSLNNNDTTLEEYACVEHLPNYLVTW